MHFHADALSALLDLHAKQPRKEHTSLFVATSGSCAIWSCLVLAACREEAGRF